MSTPISPSDSPRKKVRTVTEVMADKDAADDKKKAKRAAKEAKKAKAAFEAVVPPGVEGLELPNRAPKGKNALYTDAAAEFILERLEDGIPLNQTHKNYPTVCPKPGTVRKWTRTNEDFKVRLNEAFELFLHAKAEELESVASAPAEELFPGVERSEVYQLRRNKMDAIKFMLTKIAPLYSKAWQVESVVEHKGLENMGAQVVVVNYAVPAQPAPKSVESVIDVNADMHGKVAIERDER